MDNVQHHCNDTKSGLSFGSTYRAGFNSKHHKPLPITPTNNAHERSLSHRSKKLYKKEYLGNTCFQSSSERWTSTETHSITTSFISPAIIKQKTPHKPLPFIASKHHINIDSESKMNQNTSQQSLFSLSTSNSSDIEENLCSVSPKTLPIIASKYMVQSDVETPLSLSESESKYGGVTADELLQLISRGQCDSDYDTDIEESPELPSPKNANTKSKSKTRVIPSILRVSHQIDSPPIIGITRSISQNGDNMKLDMLSYSLTDESTDDEDKANDALVLSMSL